MEDEEALLVLHLAHGCVRMRAELAQPYAVHLEPTFFLHRNQTCCQIGRTGIEYLLMLVQLLETTHMLL